MAQQLGDLASMVAAPLRGIVGVHTGGAEQGQALGILFLAQLQGLFAFLQAGAGDHQLRLAGLSGAFEDAVHVGAQIGSGGVDSATDNHAHYQTDRPALIDRLVDAAYWVRATWGARAPAR